MFPNIRAEMARHNLTASEMAARLDIDERTLGNKLAGKSEFKWSEVRRIRSMFFPACSFDYLFINDSELTNGDTRESEKPPAH